MHLGENYITFKISSDGKVNFVPDKLIQSTSFEMQQILEDIASETSQHIEKLLREKLLDGRGKEDGKEK